MSKEKSNIRSLCDRVIGYFKYNGIKKTVLICLDKLKITNYLSKLKATVFPDKSVTNFEILTALAIIQKELRELKNKIDLKDMDDSNK